MNSKRYCLIGFITILFGVSCFSFYQFGKSSRLNINVKNSAAPIEVNSEYTGLEVEHKELDTIEVDETIKVLNNDFSKLENKMSALEKTSLELESLERRYQNFQVSIEEQGEIVEQLAKLEEMPHPEQLPRLDLNSTPTPVGSKGVMRDYEQETGIPAEKIESLMNE